MDNSKSILVISPTFPYPLVSGGKLRIFHILRQLAKQYTVTLLTLAEQGDDTPGSRQALGFLEELIAVPIDQSKTSQISRIIANAHRYLLGEPAVNIVKRSAGMEREIGKILSRKRFAAVQIEYSQYMQYLPLVRSFNIPCLVVAHDVSHVSLMRNAGVASGVRRLFWAREAKCMSAFEQAMWPRVDRIIAMSETDRDYILSLLPDAKADVVPNGVDISDYRASRDKYEVPTITFVGWMRHHPNLDAVSWFFREIWPIIRESHETVRFDVIGKGLPEGIGQDMKKDGRVRYLGFIEDIRSAVGKSWISVVPLRIGSGTRLKILESMALGTPVVSTTIGTEGIQATDGKDILIADTPDAFATQVLGLLEDEARRKKLAAAGRMLVEDKYGWEKIGILAGDALEKAINGSGSISIDRNRIMMNITSDRKESYR